MNQRSKPETPYSSNRSPDTGSQACGRSTSCRISQWLPSGATVTSLRNAIYFPDNEHVRPNVILMAWAAGLFVVMLAVAQRRRVSPGVT